MDDSILNTIKKLLGIDKDDTSFDTDIIVSINSVLMTVGQLGIGPSSGFNITGSTETWVQFLGSVKNLEAIKSYIHLRVRIIFDPPASSTILDAINRSLNEFEWRLIMQVELPSLILPESEEI